jgi:hypothetical protein
VHKEATFKSEVATKERAAGNFVPNYCSTIAASVCRLQLKP